MEKILIVDANDNVLGEEEKERCHDGTGILHRAFLAVVTDPQGNILLTRRSRTKRLWPGYWDGSVASHVRKGETYVSASARRLQEELGCTARGVRYLFKFEYQAAYGTLGTEHEICAVTLARNVSVPQLRPAEDEIEEMTVLPPWQLSDEIERTPDLYTPWLVLAVRKLEDAHLLFFSPALPRGGR